MSGAGAAEAVAHDVLRCGELPPGFFRDVAGRYRAEVIEVCADQPLPGSFWGYPEAGLTSGHIYIAAPTPVHSFFHELSHWVCMTPQRRAQLDTDAGGTDDEESAVCYLQIVLGTQYECIGKQRMLADMDCWGYSFRLGSATAWFGDDARDARDWLVRERLIDKRNRPTWRMRERGMECASF